MADVHLPMTLAPLFAGLPRRIELDAATVDEAIGQLEEQFPGLRDRLCVPGPVLRPHIHVYVDRASAMPRSQRRSQPRRESMSWPRSAAGSRSFAQPLRVFTRSPSP